MKVQRKEAESFGSAFFICFLLQQCRQMKIRKREDIQFSREKPIKNGVRKVPIGRPRGNPYFPSGAHLFILSNGIKVEIFKLKPFLIRKGGPP